MDISFPLEKFSSESARNYPNENIKNQKNVRIESVPRQEEGSTVKYQHEVKRVPEGAA